MMLKQTKKIAGFTLLEILIALAIVATITILSQRGLSEILKLANRVDETDQHIQLIDAIFSQMEIDFEQTELYMQKTGNISDDIYFYEEGFLLTHTKREPNQPSQLKQSFWIIKDQSLLRTTQPVNNDESSTTSEVLPIIGMRIRFWNENSGWSKYKSFGEVKEIEHETPNYQGQSNRLDLQLTFVKKDGLETGIRAIEVTLTPKNKQSVVRIFTLGGKS